MVVAKHVLVVRKSYEMSWMTEIIKQHELDAPCRSSGGRPDRADLRKQYGGVMRIRRVLVIPSILALAVAGSALAGAEISAAVVHTSTAPVQVSAVSISPNTFYHG